MFLGNTGFEWPVVYFATTEGHSSELLLVVWDVIYAVKMSEFKVSYRPIILWLYRIITSMS